MRVAYLGPDGIDIQETAIPAPGSGEILVKVQACAICGTDALKWRNHTATREWGHEILGRRVDTQELVTIRTTFPCGKCAACLRGEPARCTSWSRAVFTGFGDYIKVNRNCAIPVKNHSAEDVYILAEPLNVAVKLVERLNLTQSDRVSVIGNGPIGMLAAVFAKKQYGCDAAVFSRNNSRIRQDLCLKSDITRIPFDCIQTHLKQYNKIVCTAPYEVVPALVEHAGTYTDIVFNGIGGVPSNLMDLSRIHFQNISLLGSFPHPQGCFERAMAFLDDNSELLNSFITHAYPLDRIDQAFQRTLDPDREFLKILIVMET